MEIDAEKKWYIVYTRPRTEMKLAGILTKKDIAYFLPLLRLRQQWSDRLKWVEKPAFDSYVFVFLNLAKQGLTVRKIPYTVQFVLSAGIPAEISPNDMELLRISLANFSETIIIRDTSALHQGQKVRVKWGPFAGRDAVIERIRGKTMLTLAFPALNKTILVEIPVEHLESATDHLINS